MTATRVRSEHRQRTGLIAFRVLPAEMEQIQQAAARAGVSVSELARRAALNDEPLHEWSCPSCGGTTRARMADRETP